MFLEAGLLTRRSVCQFEKGKKLTKADFEDLLKMDKNNVLHLIQFSYL